MAEALLVGAAVGAAFGELLKVVLDEGKKTIMFKSELKLLESTLISIQPMFDEMEKMNTVLNRPKRETDMFVDRLRAGRDLVLECSTIKSWSLLKKNKYANKLIKLDESLLRFFQMDVQGQMACDVKRLSVGVNDISDTVNQIRSSMKKKGDGADGDTSYKLDRVLSILEKGRGLAGSCGVPGLPDLDVGLDKPLRELKEMLLEDGVPGLVISAPGGCGKTTLVQALCHDDQIRGTLKVNIDGTLKVNIDGNAEGGFRGLARDKNGAWVAGFNGKLFETATCLQTELEGIYYGLKLIKERNWRNTIVESYSRSAVYVVNKPNGCNDCHRHRILIEDCIDMLNSTGAKLVHTMRY